ncbi:MAG: hypothetical protein WB524_22955 [Acidobacteriaceae bacterium]
MTRLPEKSIALVVTDPPFFDNVHYSELADFFYSRQKFAPARHFDNGYTRRSPQEVQDAEADSFTENYATFLVSVTASYKTMGS